MSLLKLAKHKINKKILNSLGAIGFFAAGLLAYPFLINKIPEINNHLPTPTAKIPTTSSPLIATDSEHLEVCFTPDQSCLPQVIQRIDNAKSNILLLGYSFTSKPISDALVRAKNRGVKVRVVLDRSQKTQKSSKEALESLLLGKIEVRFDHSVKIAHNKIILIDGEQTVTGSYNWTHSAEFKNAENLVFIGSKSITKRYTDYFERRWKISAPSLKDISNAHVNVKNVSKKKSR